MVLKYNNIEISNSVIDNSLKRLTNQIYKLLPNREENIDWKSPLNTIIEELSGMDRLLFDQHEDTFFALLCKLEGLFTLTNEDDFYSYRRTIFECLNLISGLRDTLCQE